MSNPKILVTGATGKTGSAVVEQLRRDDWPVRALVHRIDERSDRLARMGAEVVAADMHDPDQLFDATRGTQRAYYLPILQPHMVQAATAFALAAREAKLEAVVQLSQWLSHRSHPSILTRETWLVDHLFSMIPGTAHVIVNPGMFADNFLRTMDFASLLYFFPVLTGDSQSAPVSNEDIARVATALLKNPLPHAGRSYRPTGLRLLSGKDMAAVLAKVTGHAVMPVELPFWMFSKAARMSGASIHEICNFREYLRDYRAGSFSLGGGVNTVVADITGQPAEDFETIARRYAALPFAQPTWRNRLAALARFSILPVYPGHDVDRYQRQMRFPVPPAPSLSSADAGWIATHGGADALNAQPHVRGFMAADATQAASAMPGATNAQA